MKTYVFLLVVFLLFGSVSLVVAQTSPDAYITALDAKQSTMSSQQKIEYQKKTFALLSLQTLRYRHDAEQVATLQYITNHLTNQLNAHSSVASPSVSAITSTITLATDIPFVDMEKVRAAWLQWHNDERATKSLDPLVYHFALESTATTWAKYLGSIRDTTHTRNAGDGYYSYSAIKQRFIDQWIVFAGKEQSGQSLFTENLWRNMYSCKKTDCTDDFITAIKKSWTFFMSEKWRSYKPHYNAIVGDYTNIGLGIAISGTRYYLVSHYAQDLN